jgi:hypothetical protein
VGRSARYTFEQKVNIFGVSGQVISPSCPAEEYKSLGPESVHLAAYEMHVIRNIRKIEIFCFYVREHSIEFNIQYTIN